MTGRRGLAGAVGVMFSGTFVSRGLGYVRAALLTVALGTMGGAAGAFAVANTLPNTIYMLLAGGVINAVFVPQLVRSAKQADGGQEFANRLLTVAGAALLAVTVLLTASSVLLVQLYASQMKPEWLPVAYAFAFWCVPQVFFYGLYTLLGQVLNAREVFGPYMWAPVLNNIIAIGGIAFYIYQFGAMPFPELGAGQFGQDRIVVLGATATAGVVAQALILIVPLWRAGFRYRPRWGLQGLGSAGQMGGWTFAALVVGQLGFLAVSNVAVAAGSYGTEAEPIANNATYQLAFTVFMLPQSLIVVSVVTAMFTRLSQRASSRNGAGVRDDLSMSMRTVSVFTVLSAVAIFTLALPISQVITVGARPQQEVIDLSLVVSALAVGIPGLALWSVVQRVYYAYQDAKSLFWIQVAMAGVVAGGSVIGTFILHPAGWVIGAGISISVSYYVGALVGYVGLRRRLLSLDGARVLRTHLRLFIAAVPTAVVGVLVVDEDRWPSVLGAIGQIIGAGIVMTLVYLLVAHLLGVREIAPVTNRITPVISAVAARLGLPRRTMAADPGAGGLSSEQRGDAEVLDDTLTSGMLLASRYRVDDLQPSPLPGVRGWVGHDTVLERPVEVLSISGRHAEDVLDGARRVGLVEDPHLPKVLRVGEHEGTGYVVLEPFPVTTVAELLAYGPIDPEAARSIAGETAKALEAARRRGVHHLGLTPQLVGLTRAGGVEVLGIGIAGPALGLAPSPDEAAATDAQAVVSLLRAMVGPDSPLLTDLADVASVTGVEVVLAPWRPVPPSAQLREGAGAPPLLEPIPYDPDATSVLQAQVGELDEHTLRVVSSWHPDVANISPPPAFEAVLAGDEDDHAQAPETSADGAAPSPEPGPDREAPSQSSTAVRAEGGAPTGPAAPVRGAMGHDGVAHPGASASAGEGGAAIAAGVGAAGAAAGAAGRIRSWLRTLDRIIPAEDPQRRGIGGRSAQSDPGGDPGTPAGGAGAMGGASAGSAPWLTKTSGQASQGGEAVVAPGGSAAGEMPAPENPDPAHWRVRAPEMFADPPTFAGAVGPEEEAPTGEENPDSVTHARHVTDPEEQVTALGAWVAGQRESFQIWRSQRREATPAPIAAPRSGTSAAPGPAASPPQGATVAPAQAPQSARPSVPAPPQAPTAPMRVSARPESVQPTAPPSTVAQPTAPQPVQRQQASRLPLADPFDQTAEDAERYEVPTRPTGTWGSMNATPFVLVAVLIGVAWVFWLAVSSLISTARSGPEQAPEPTNNLIPDPAQTTEGSEPTDEGSEPTDEGTAWAPLPEGSTTGEPLAEVAPGVDPADWVSIAV